MTVGDFINDPFGTVAKAGLDAAPDEVRETLHGVAESVTNPTLPDSSALVESFSAGSTESQYPDGPADVGGFTSGAAHSDPMGAAGEVDSGSAIPDLGGVDVRNSLDIISDDKENWDTNNDWGPPDPPHADLPPSEIIHPDPYADPSSQPQTAGELAADSGAGGEVDSGVFDDVF